jgi:hypothetical protein
MVVIDGARHDAPASHPQMFADAVVRATLASVTGR